MELVDKAQCIVDFCLESKETAPFALFKQIVDLECVNIHGPEHHIVDGACLLTCFKNAGGNIDLKAALEKMKNEGLKMPGGICGNWGVCGAVMSIGCALSIIDQTGPLETNGNWGKHIQYTAKALERLGQTYGPRCCKRDGLISIQVGIDYINENTNVKLDSTGAECFYSHLNKQCIKEKCPFYK